MMSRCMCDLNAVCEAASALTLHPEHFVHRDPHGAPRGGISVTGISANHNGRTEHDCTCSQIWQRLPNWARLAIGPHEGQVIGKFQIAHWRWNFALT